MASLEDCVVAVSYGGQASVFCWWAARRIYKGSLFLDGLLHHPRGIGDLRRARSESTRPRPDPGQFGITRTGGAFDGKIKIGLLLAALADQQPPLASGALQRAYSVFPETGSCYHEALLDPR